MGIIFFCQSCGARFEVSPGQAGKKGRCKRCGQNMQVPRAEQLASMTGMNAVPHAGGPAAAGPLAAGAVAASMRGDSGQAQSMSNWLRAAATSVGLSPLTVDHMPVIGREWAKKIDDDLGDSKPYMVMSGYDPGAALAHGSGKPAGIVTRVWRRETGQVAKLLRKTNELAYMVSIPFILILLFGTVTKSRGTALFAATFVVLLCAIRIVSGVANLMVVPLRDGLNSGKMKKPFKRVVEPVVMIAVILAGFTFIPWLRSDRAASGSLADRLKAEAVELKGEMKGELLKRADEASKIDVEKIGTKVQSTLKELGTPPEGQKGQAAPKGKAGDQPKSPEAAIQGILQDVGKRARQAVEESQKNP